MLRSVLVPVVVAGLSVAAFVALAEDVSRARDRIPDSDPATFTPLRGQPLTFSPRCEPATQTVVLGFMGDLLVHNAPHKQAIAKRFRSLWAPMMPLWKAADFTYANLEGTLQPLSAPARAKASENNRVAYHHAFAPALKDAGIDLVSTANNHAADHGSAGIRATLDGLDAARLLHTGTRRSASDPSPWHAITELNGIKIAWIACTEWNNDDDPDGLVLHCHRNRPELLALVSRLAAETDAVIVTPHGGTEKRTRPNVITRGLQRELVEAGALLVIGNHPHTLQQWEKMTTTAGREAFVSSCSGAALTRLKAGERRFGAYLLASLARGVDGVVRVQEVRHVPYVWSRDDGAYRMEPAWAHPQGDRARKRVNAILSEENEIGAAAFDAAASDDAPLSLTDACATL